MTVNGPTLDPVPLGIETDFAIRRAGMFFTAIFVGLISPNFFAIVIPFGFGPLQRVRYVPAGPVWFNADGGRLLAFDLPVNFP